MFLDKLKGQTKFIDKLQFDKQSTNKPNGLTPPPLLEKRGRGETPIAVYLKNNKRADQKSALLLFFR